MSLVTTVWTHMNRKTLELCTNLKDNCSN